jgi:superfamily II DNA/RNA helicase
MVFCQTRRMADQVAGALEARGFAVASVHGDLGQGQRERALRAFRNGKVDVLVATDVAARGLDVDDVTHVVNYECPEDDKAYLHRTGRTGRAGRTGIAVTFVDWRDMRRWKLIDESLGLGHPEPAETYSTSEHLFDELRIPETATGTLPVGQRERAGLGAEDIEDIGETGRVRSQQRSRPGSARGRARSGRGRAAGGKNGAGQDRGTQGDGAARGQAGQGKTGQGKTGQGQGTDGSAKTGASRARIRRRTRRGQDVSHARRQAG